MTETTQQLQKYTLATDAPGHIAVLLGNEAIARGAIEAGVQVAAAYPGTPSSEILESIGKVAKEANIYAQWSVNEKVAAEVAMSASLSGLRAITSMKAEGLNAALDFVTLINTNEIGDGGLVLVVCDDPQGWSSNSEHDSRWSARSRGFPLLEPSSPSEAKEMVKWAFSFSEKLRLAVLIRSVTRISHASAPVAFGDYEHLNRQAHFDTQEYVSPFPVTGNHLRCQQKLEGARVIFESSQFNWYHGPKSAKLTIVCSGTGWLYSLDAIQKLGLESSVGIIKLGTTWPLPIQFIQNHLQPDSDVLVVEEVDPFVEAQLKEYLGTHWLKGGIPKVYGKESGHINSVGELNQDIVIEAITKLLGLSYHPRESEYDKKAVRYAQEMVQDRPWAWCPGCPHRASLRTMKNVLRLDDTANFINGDVGCYAIDGLKAGTMTTKTYYVMGSGSGLASGFGKLERFGFKQQAVATIGDSTFFHAAIPAIINSVHHRANATFVILDNNATAMTGFQPHPGTAESVMQEPVTQVDIERVCRSLGCPVEVADSFDIEDSEQKLWKLIEQEGSKIMILRHKCGLVAFREDGPEYKVWVESEKCLGEDCGCNRYCNRIFKCPALIWDEATGKARIDEAICTGCGFCANICPRQAISRLLLPVEHT